MTDTFDPQQHVFQSPELRSVVYDAIAFFNLTSAYRLPPPQSFRGAGVYALYYTGDFEHYRIMTAANVEQCVLPIYVGKAVPEGWRTARTQLTQSPVLYRRLREHNRSIEQTENLQATHFWCRFMILQDIEGDLVVPVEAELIRRYRPLWNTVIDGFGNHDPGSGRYDQAPSEWDILHPGRSWAERLKGIPPSLEAVVHNVQRYLTDFS